MRNKYLILLVLLFTIGIVSGSFADKLGDGALYDVFNSGGAVLEGNGYKILNSIAEPVSGKIGDSTSSVWWGLFGLFGGVIEKPGVPYGTVPLAIERDGNDVKITWEAIYVNPTIVALSGGGKGSYTNNSSDDWYTVLQGGVVKTPPALMGPVVLSNATTLRHTQQVGGGTSECYYKGFQAAIGEPKTAINPNTNALIFPTAMAAGKVNVLISGGKKWTAMSIPFLLQSTDLNILIGDVGYGGTANSDQDVLLFSWESGAWNKASYFNGTSWTSLTPTPAVYDGHKGLYFLTRQSDSDKKITVVGTVEMPSETVSYAITPNLNLMSFPYPKQMQLSKLNLVVGAGNNVSDSADIVFGWKDNSWNLASYLNGSKVWTNLTPTGVDLLDTAKPVLYLSRSSSNVNYKFKPSALGYE